MRQAPTYLSSERASSILLVYAKLLEAHVRAGAGDGWHRKEITTVQKE